MRHLAEQVRRKGPLWRNSAFAFESANHFLLSSVSGPLKTLSHVIDNFLLRQKRAHCLSSPDETDDPFLFATECSRIFALRDCGPGKLRSRSFFSCNSETIGSLCYSRLRGNWSECITRLKNGECVAVVLYHVDTDGSTTSIVRKYRSMDVKFYVESNSTFYHQLHDLDSKYSTVSKKEIDATRVVVLSGNLENCLISFVEEGFEHN